MIEPEITVNQVLLSWGNAQCLSNLLNTNHFTSNDAPPTGIVRVPMKYLAGLQCLPQVKVGSGQGRHSNHRQIRLQRMMFLVRRMPLDFFEELHKSGFQPCFHRITASEFSK